MLLSPLLGALFLAVQPNLAAQRQAAAPDGDASRVRCPACAEWVLPQAIKCKHCGGELVPQPLAAPVPERPAEGLEPDQQNVLLVAGFLLAVVLVVVWVVKRFG